MCVTKRINCEYWQEFERLKLEGYQVVNHESGYDPNKVPILTTFLKHPNGDTARIFKYQL